MSAVDTKMGIYVNAALKDEVDSLAALHERSFSKQATWLCKLGLRAVHLLPPKPAKRLEASAGRQWLYPSEVTYVEIEELQSRLVDRTGNPWPLSGLCRELMKIGLRIEWWVAQTLDTGAARLSVHRSITQGSTTAQLALVLVMKHSTLDLLDLDHAGPDVDSLKTWNTTAEKWKSAMRVAIEARCQIDTLEDVEIDDAES